MSTNSIFFSYSRDNSDFVLNLAKELREAGAEVWLDQLDIKPGTRWDKSIETALASSSTLLVVLSKSSVASNNVMDEVSYALEEGKTVVPILLEECEIPFRLRRLQFADFTSSHDTGIATLTSALNLDAEVSSKLVHDAPPATTATEAPKQEAPQKPTEPKPVANNPVAAAASKTEPKEAVQSHSASTDTAKPSKSKKPLIYAVVAIVAVLATYGIYTAVTGGAEDMMALCKADWEELEAETPANDGNDVSKLAALKNHIALYAPCPHEAEAMDKISFLEAMGSDTNALTTELDEAAATNESTEPPVEIVEKVQEVVLTGLNVMRVDHASGNFVQKTPKFWLETHEGKERQFLLLKRDINAIYLGDGPVVRLTLDISNSVIIYSDTFTEPFNLYTITGTSDTNN